MIAVIADLTYLRGSIFHVQGMADREAFLTGLTILLNLVFLLGLLYRQRSGPANRGFESVLMLVLYIIGISVLAMTM